MEKTQKVIKISKKKLFISVGIVIFIFVVLYGYKIWNGNYGRGGTVMMEKMNTGAIPSIGSSIKHDGLVSNSTPVRPCYSYERCDMNSGSSYKDTREFMKETYNANFKTRDVRDTMRDIRNIIKDNDGRIDNTNENELYGSISFVVSKSKFDTIRDEFGNLVAEKLFTENTSSYNLLSEKQGIEKVAETNEQQLARLKSEENTLLREHNAELKRITDMTSEIDHILMTSKFSDPSYVENYNNQKIELQKDIEEENSIYAIELKSIKNRLAVVNTNIKNNTKADQAFTDNIETVNGYVNVSYATYWQIARLISPIHPTIIIILLLIIIKMILYKKKILPKVELV